MVRRTKEEALETRNRILDAAETVFHTRGVARPSLADIAEAAGVTRGAIYWHFKNKSDVFAAMVDRVNLPVEALCDPERIARHEDPLGGIRDICAFVFRQTVVNPQWRRIFEILFHKCEMVQDNGAIFERQRQSHKEGVAKIREHLRLAAERGQLPADLDLDFAVNAFHAAIGGVLAHWLFCPTDFDLAGQAERMADVFIDTLRFSPALRHGYVARPLAEAELDAEVATFCEAQARQQSLAE
ncbi:TetR family transcriptional regulator [Cupriavidus plantarum]|uniref:TetR family transcriptional regulator n=1 Tax=Cupriavidus plantarum TaxID=942865 RepID=A0A316F1Z1_9BURK|nr:TetR family transcriptional regulator [Cupriavidus plantarum]NYH97441.1 TetR/AcrR family acrAB operon transcriptional repressor [Cupriavidus plantarum]PWK38947.1 TetR family transcriptional regulator [Cupriavidus plantarum]REE92577.1 TetR family transcriptional regulator [Cupriavidus plantarum]RLK36139.1 TetR family transcriptional regulator [Cupriavidus plantarum]CAG2150422.1 HTH-type transcriptional regulator TtgR [Cupriavidus plantarum]